jgi:poly-gamma-glutamate synthase PgsB/CapB
MRVEAEGLERVKELLITGMPPFFTKMEARRIEGIINEFLSWLSASDRPLPDERTELQRELIAFLSYNIKTKLSRTEELKKQHLEFIKGLQSLVTTEDIRRHILEYARDLGASPRQLKGDRRAFNRWFGQDAVTDRYRRILLETEKMIALSLDCLGRIAADFISIHGEALGYRRLWRHFKIEQLLTPFFSYEVPTNIRLNAFRAMSRILKAMPQEYQEGAVEDSILQYIYRSALDINQDVWIQREALDLLESLSPSSFVKALRRRLEEPQRGDDLFVRRHCVRLLGNNLRRLPQLLDLIPVASEDPSPYVRQALPHALIEAPADYVREWLYRLAIKDPSPQVRAMALLEIENVIKTGELFDDMLMIITESLRNEKDEFVQRAGLEAVVRTSEAALNTLDKYMAMEWFNTIKEEVEWLHQNAESIPVRRWASRCRERLWGLYDTGAQRLIKILETELEGLERGKKRYLPSDLIREFGEERLCRVLSLMSQEEFEYHLGREITGRYFITKGPVFRFKLWRLIHEFLHPSPDKRQAFPHTTGRCFYGNIHIPSSIMAELTETKVPGEPLYISSEGGWRPYLPLVDELISSLRRGYKGPVRLYTSEGITEIKPPDSLFKRLKAYLKLTLRFAHYARLRNWHEDMQLKPSAYIEAISKLGFKITHTGWTLRTEETPVDPAVRRFFVPVIGFLSPDILNNIKDYFFSVYKNSLYELAVFTGIIIIAFVLSIIFQSITIRRARTNFPLVIGGWGTRGKSGTERLKAALINALGYSLISKTTGCEAFFLYSTQFSKLTELFIFRPYDKATIWEQDNLMRLAEKLRCDVFLWECMGLTPSYVRILQRKWARDDISTITNTYPDHEDIQGPAGINIAEVMTEFIPESAILLSSEEEMKPILAEAAKKLGTRVRFVNWLDAGLLTPDIMERFPYEEHPYNIALVLALADELGIDRDFAIKEMADRVIPDIGVLKAFPPAPVRTRRLEFVNGMSANERYGCLTNWARMGFRDHDYMNRPGELISTVVNNRADRIARSQVFARIIVEDISADRHFLIGTNLKGLLGYIRQAWDDYISRISPWSGPSASHSPESVVERLARRLRIPITKEQVDNRLRAMLSGIGIKPDEQIEALVSMSDDLDRLRERLNELGYGDYSEGIIRHIRDYSDMNREYESLIKKVREAGSSGDERLEAEFRETMWRWFNKKIHVIWDPHASGNTIINIITEETPPGLHNRIMGIQNIKGTGMDFVYRWQAWDKCHHYCTQLLKGDEKEFEEALSSLSVFQDFGILCEEFVRETIEKARTLPHAQNEKAQAELTVTLSNLENQMKWVKERAGIHPRSGLMVKVIDAIESFMDIGDAVKRRKKADRIYKDLSDERISLERAAKELSNLNMRQKGGWLREYLLKG